MAKITISRIYELSRYLATEAGKQLADPLTFMSELAEQVLRNLRNGLTFADNINCEIKTVKVRHDTETTISTTKRPEMIVIRRVVDTAYYQWDAFGWRFASDGSVILKVTFSGSPPATTDISVDILISYG